MRGETTEEKEDTPTTIEVDALGTAANLAMKVRDGSILTSIREAERREAEVWALIAIAAELRELRQAWASREE